MRIALLTDGSETSALDLRSSFMLHALETYLQGHEITRVYQAPTAETISLLNRHDVVLLTGLPPLGSEVDSFAFQPEHFQSIKPKIAPLGLSVESFSGKKPPYTERQIATLQHLKSRMGQISVRDPLSQDYLDDLLGPGSSLLTGCPTLLGRERPFSHSEGRFVFAAGAFSPEGRHEKIMREINHKLYRLLCQKRPTLFLAQDSQALNLGALPGTRTLHSPRFPHLHMKALATSRGILSFRLEPALAGLAQGIPAFLVAGDAASISLAETLSLPHLVWDENLSAEQIFEGFVENLNHYPWEEIHQRREVFLQRTEDYLDELGIKVRPRQMAQASGSPEVESPLTEGNICCIADKNYLPFLKGFIENLLTVHSGVLELHLLALQNEVRDFILSQFPDLKLHVYRLADLWERHELEEILTRPLAHQAYASKSRLLSKALAQNGKPSLYFDLDIYFFQSSTLR